jgi:hypothetical protein
MAGKCLFKKIGEGGDMNFLWTIALGLAVSCFSGDAFGMFGYQSTEMKLFGAIKNGNDQEAIKLIDKKATIGWGYATNLDQTTDLEIKPMVEVTTRRMPKFSVTKIENATPLILAAWFKRSNIIDKLIAEQETNKRPIGNKKQAIISGLNVAENKEEKIKDASAIDVARFRGYKKLVKKLIAAKIGSKLDLQTAQEWLNNLELKDKLKTLQESLTKLKAKLNQLTQSLQQLKSGLTV